MKVRRPFTVLSIWAGSITFASGSLKSNPVEDIAKASTIDIFIRNRVADPADSIIKK